MTSSPPGEGAGRGEEAVRDAIDPRVLEMPDGSRLSDGLADEPDGAVGLADDLRVLADLALGRGALFIARVVR